MRALLSVLVIVILYSSSVAQKRDDQTVSEVKACFAGYKKALLESKGNEAVKWTDSHTLAYYSKMLVLAVQADSLQVQALPMMDKLMVFTVRHCIPKEEALQMEGTGFFVYAIDHGMINKNSMMDLSLGEVKVEGNFARGEIIANGQNASIYFHFNKEKEGWKIDITSILPETNQVLKEVVAASGMKEHEFISLTLQLMTGSNPELSIWKPLK